MVFTISTPLTEKIERIYGTLLDEIKEMIKSQKDINSFMRQHDGIVISKNYRVSAKPWPGISGSWKIHIQHHSGTTVAVVHLLGTAKNVNDLAEAAAESAKSGCLCIVH